MATHAEQSTQSTTDGPPDTAGRENAPEAVEPQSNTDAELAQMEDRWRRAVADADNLRKRHARELDRERNSERSRVVGAWLPIVDNLERAIGHAAEQSGALVDGVRNILEQAVQALEHLGYVRDAEAGVPFDPERHEVVGVIDHPDSQPGTVVEVVRPGYGKGASQLRPAAVVVSRREE